jgi:hypothetical protein
LKDPSVKKLFDSIKKDGLQRWPSMPKGNVVVHTHQRSGEERRAPSTSKATGPNPKDVVGSVKVAMLLFPPIAHIHAADAMMDGAGKYDPYNWRAKNILCTTYLHAAVRHIIDYWEGEECAPDSRAKHLGHAIATLGIVLDAAAHGCLIDDRPSSDGGAALNAALAQVTENEVFRRQRRAVKTTGAKSGRCSGTKKNQPNVQKAKK